MSFKKFLAEAFVPNILYHNKPKDIFVNPNVREWKELERSLDEMGGNDVRGIYVEAKDKLYVWSSEPNHEIMRKKLGYAYTQKGIWNLYFYPKTREHSKNIHLKEMEGSFLKAALQRYPKSIGEWA